MDSQSSDTNRFNGKCGICGKEFTGRRNKKWCSDECKLKNHMAEKARKRNEIIIRHFSNMNRELRENKLEPFGLENA